jgi:Ca2+-transporting ATPase
MLPLLFGMPLILAPIHIAFLELVIDPACSIVFEAETGSPQLMAQSPRSRLESLVSRGHIFLSLTQGVLVTLVSALVYWCLLQTGNTVEVARTLTFIVLVTANAGWAAMFSGLSAAGTWVLIVTIAGLALVTSLPVLARTFTFQPPSLSQWLSAFIIGVGMLLLFESVKIAYSRTKTIC